MAGGRLSRFRSITQPDNASMPCCSCAAVAVAAQVETINSLAASVGGLTRSCGRRLTLGENNNPLARKIVDVASVILSEQGK